MAKFFINRPIVAIVISIIFVIVGVVAILGLPIAQYPDIVPPEIVINTTYVGADAQTVEQSVATPIEQEMSGVDNMNYMYSLNANNGELKLYVNFDVKTDPNIDQVLTQMRKSPGGLQAALRGAQLRGHGQEVHVLAAHAGGASPRPSGSYDATFLANYAYINLNDQITRVPGIASVTVFGAGQYAMRLLGQAGPAGQAEHHRPGDRGRHQEAEHGQPGRAGRGGARARRQEYTYAIRAQGRLETSGGVRADRPARQPGRVDRAAERRGPHRAGLPDLRNVRAG